MDKKIPYEIPKKDLFLMKNKYEVLCQNKKIDLNVIIYYLEDNKIKIIIRRLDEEYGWNEQISLKIFDLENLNHRIIECGSSVNIEKKINIMVDLKIYPLKHQNQLIPKFIYQTYETNNYHNNHHYNAVQSFLDYNPDYNYEFYDDAKCAEFIKNNFDTEIFKAYIKLYPSAYKADLFRYCLIYKKGGCYFDNKYIPRKSLSYIINENDKNVYCYDINDNLMFNSIIISIPSEKYFKNLIDNIIKNVNNNFYGESPLHPTGPRLFYEYTKDKNVILKHNIKNPKTYYINSCVSLINSNEIIFNTHYKGYYYNKNHRNKEKNDYDKCWNTRKIYI